MESREWRSRLVLDFKQLDVYKAAYQAAIQIHLLSKGFPIEERYSLTDQVRRSSRSVCVNIAEAWRKRRYRASFVAKLSDAEGEAAETQVWLDFSLHFGMISEEQDAKLSDQYDQVCRMLAKMVQNATQWCPRSA